MPRKVAVEVDSVRVAAGSGGGAVRVEVGNDPEVGLGRPPGRDESLGDRDAGALVAVDAADDKRLALRVGVAGLHSGDRAAAD